MGVAVMAAMAGAGYYLLDYLVSGEEVVVPSVYGMTKAQAMEKLFESDLWLNPEIEEVYNQNVEPGVIIEQRPQPNEHVKKKRSVTVTISAGAREIDIPDVTGKYENDAVNTLRFAGLDIGQTASVFHDRIPEKGVIAQDPLPGRHRSFGNKVNLLISLGVLPQGYVMPNYLQQNIETVLKQFKQQNTIEIIPEVKYIPTPDTSQWNTIIEQRPQPGTRFTTGEQVIFHVGSSGTTASDIQLIQISFTYPQTVKNLNALTLLIWDESSHVRDQDSAEANAPMCIPLDGFYPGLVIEKWIPVMGNAYVVLAEVDETEGNFITEIHDERWYKMSALSLMETP